MYAVDTTKSIDPAIILLRYVTFKVQDHEHLWAQYNTFDLTLYAKDL